MLHMCGYDSEHWGSPTWNPLGAFITPGQTVLLKPNLVFHNSHKEGEDYYSVVTHPALIRAITDYVVIALRGKGRIIIGDAPLNNARFDLLVQHLGLDSLQRLNAHTGLTFDIADFRMYTMEKDGRGVIRNQRRASAGDEFVVVSLDGQSVLSRYDAQYRRFRVTEYDGRLMPLYHKPGVHQYAFHKSLCEADVIINLPKIKTHRKAGYTCAMKNFVGLNANKDWLPHHRKGSAARGGDEYLHHSLRKALVSRSWDIRWKLSSPAAQKALLAFEHILLRSQALFPFRDDFFEGSWWGNQTISRTIRDLNCAVLYVDRTGHLCPSRQRRVLHLVDGIVCGEGEGPMAATARRCNILLWGLNAYVVDQTVVRLMGFDHRKIDTLRVAANGSSHPIFAGTLEDIRITTNLAPNPVSLGQVRKYAAYQFEPSAGWKGHIELEAGETR
jgi:uncharacterized protein (DUF362 family)